MMSYSRWYQDPQKDTSGIPAVTLSGLQHSSVPIPYLDPLSDLQVADTIPQSYTPPRTNVALHPTEIYHTVQSRLKLYTKHIKTADDIAEFFERMHLFR